MHRVCLQPTPPNGQSLQVFYQILSPDLLNGMLHKRKWLWRRQPNDREKCLPPMLNKKCNLQNILYTVRAAETARKGLLKLGCCPLALGKFHPGHVYVMRRLLPRFTQMLVLVWGSQPVASHLPQSGSSAAVFELAFPSSVHQDPACVRCKRIKGPFPHGIVGVAANDQKFLFSYFFIIFKS